MNDLLQFLKDAVPHEPRAVVGYFVVGLLLVVGLIIARAEWRNGRSRRALLRKDESAAHLQALARYHAKLHEDDGRNL